MGGASFVLFAALVQLVVGAHQVDSQGSARDDVEKVLELRDVGDEAPNLNPAVEYWDPPNVTEGDIADNGTVNGSYNYSTVSAKILMSSTLEFNNDTLDEVTTKQAVRFGHPVLITRETYNFSVVSPCGNGKRDASEECDDGNVKNGDGCSMNCTVEGGWTCESKSELQDKGVCRRCAADECTVFYNNAWRCLETKMKFSKASKKESIYQRAANGFCECHESRCILDDVCIKPEVGSNRTSGWYRHTNGSCACGDGFCLMPTAQGIEANPQKNACMKMDDAYKKDPATGLCQCADAEPAVSSTDPSVASIGKVAACKTYPSKPLQKSRSPGHTPDAYAAFQCHNNPYTTTRSDMLCDGCQSGSCKLPKELKASGGVAPVAQAGMFTCFDADAQASMGYTTKSDGTCGCDGSDSCLVPNGDSFECKSLDAAHPYGGTITSEGRCGCANDVTSCIMATSKMPNGTVDDFVCLDLGTTLNRTEYGEKFVRGSNGYCQCADTHCQTERRSESLGDFDCIDTVKDSNYKKGDSDGKCKCQSPCQFKTGTPGVEQCTTCPTEAGTCVARCNTNETSSQLSSTTCTKYCATKSVKFAVPPGKSKTDFMAKRDMIARVVECFVTKTVDCSKDEINTPYRGWLCTQKVSARMLYNCPARWSQHANRALPDGTETHGFTSVCDSNDLECQLQNCDRDTTHSGMCIDKLAVA